MLAKAGSIAVCNFRCEKLESNHKTREIELETSEKANQRNSVQVEFAVPMDCPSRIAAECRRACV
jgi:hypothetical protein